MAKKTFLVLFSILLIMFITFFSLIGVLAVTQNNNPELFKRLETPLLITLGVCVIINLGFIIVFSPKMLVAAMLFEREKLEQSTKPYIQSLRPIGRCEKLIELMQSELASDGFIFVEQIDLACNMQAKLAYHIQFHPLMLGFVAKYLLMVRLDYYTSDDLDNMLKETYRTIERLKRNRNHIHIKDYYDLISICIFSEKLSSEWEQNGIKLYDKQSKFLFALYELSTGRVVFMNGKSPRARNFAKLQNLVWKYVVGMPS